MKITSWRPGTKEEAMGRNANTKLHDKILALRNGRQAKSRTRRPNGGLFTSVLYLTDQIILNLAFAAERGKLNQVARNLFNKLSRAEILCWLLQEADHAYRLNKERYGYKKDTTPFFLKIEKSPADILIDNICRLTLDEVLEKYGASECRSERIFVSDVHYGEFLRVRGLGHRPGGNVTRDDLPSINWQALQSGDPLAKREAMIRAASNMA